MVSPLSLDAGVALNSLEIYQLSCVQLGADLPRRPAARLAREHILVNAIAPEAFASEISRAARDHAELVLLHVPSGRVGRDEDTASAAIYLAARSGDYVAGSTLIVDGGVALAPVPNISAAG